MNKTPRCSSSGCSKPATHRLLVVDRAGMRELSDHCVECGREEKTAAGSSPEVTGVTLTPIAAIHAHRRNG